MAFFIIVTFIVAFSTKYSDSYGSLQERRETILECPEGRYVGFTSGRYFTNEFSADVTRTLQINCCNKRSCLIRATNSFLGIDPHVGRRKTLEWNMICEDNLGICGSQPCGNGTCTNNCVSYTCTCYPGYKGTQCEFQCRSGTFGPKCTNLCGQCEDGGGKCDHVTGVCSNGCINGYIGRKCDFKCPGRICGINCTKNCKRMCRNNPSCNVTTGFCDECCASCLRNADRSEDARLVEKCSLEVYGLLAALTVSLLIHCGFLTMYFQRLMRKRKDVSSLTTPMYANVKSEKASTDQPDQEQTSTKINIHYEALCSSTSVQDAHDYALLVK